MSQPAQPASTSDLEGCIALVRGQRVRLVRDHACRRDGVETRVLNQAVRRHMGRFPADFRFERTRREILGMSQRVMSTGTVDSTCSKGVPACTEHGVAMLSSFLHGPCAIGANTAIIRFFVRPRQLASFTAELVARRDDLERSCDRKFRAVFDAIHRRVAPAPGATAEPPRRDIGFPTCIHGRPPCSKVRRNKKVSP
jgi:hypothetical protein